MNLGPSVDNEIQERSNSGQGSIQFSGSGPRKEERTYRLEDPFKLLVEVGSLNGFSSTGQRPKKYKPDVFETSGLKNIYVKYLKDVDDKMCDNQIALRRVYLSMVEGEYSLKPNFNSDIRMGLVTGCAGSGKTTLLKDFSCKIGVEFPTLVLVANPALIDSTFATTVNVLTMEDALLSKVVVDDIGVLVVDEYTLSSSAEVLLIARKYNVHSIILFGDLAQGRKFDGSSFEHFRVPEILTSAKSHRFGEATAAFCRRSGSNVQGNPEIQDQVNVEDYLGKIEENSQRLVFTQETREDLLECGIDALLVSDVQGMQFDVVTVFARDSDSEVIDSSVGLKEVALTRHRKLLILKLEPSIRLRLETGVKPASEREPTSDRICR